MNIKFYLKKNFPKFFSYLKKYYKISSKLFEKDITPINEQEFRRVLKEVLNVKRGDVLFIHSSLDNLKIEINALKVLEIIKETIGEEGTILFPTYPKNNSSDFLESDKTFDVTKTVSYTGILTELARRDKDAIRSIHPTKSVVAIGKYAKELTSNHHLSIDPFGIDSPYQKIEKYDAKIIGIGVSTKYLSAIHIIDSDIQNELDINPYLSKIYHAKCVDYEGKQILVETLAHDMNKMNLNIPKFINENIAKESCKDVTYKGMPFFYAEAVPLYKELKDLVDKNITVYK